MRCAIIAKMCRWILRLIKAPSRRPTARARCLSRQGLAALFPDIQIIGEEAAAETPPETIADTFFLLDALDGTREFINHRPDFTVNIGLIDNTHPVAGVVYAPAKARLFFTLGGAAYEMQAPPDSRHGQNPEP